MIPLYKQDKFGELHENYDYTWEGQNPPTLSVP